VRSDGAPLSGRNTLCNIATAQLAAAGLPWLTARSVRAAGRPSLSPTRGLRSPLPSQVRRATVVATREANLGVAAECEVAAAMGNSRGAWDSYDCRRRERSAEGCEAAWAAVLASATGKRGRRRGGQPGASAARKARKA